MVPKNPATKARINRNGSHSSGSEISCDTGVHLVFVRPLRDVALHQNGHPPNPTGGRLVERTTELYTNFSSVERTDIMQVSYG